MINDLVSLLTASSSPLSSQFRERSPVQRSTFLSGAYLYLDLSSFKVRPFSKAVKAKSFVTSDLRTRAAVTRGSMVLIHTCLTYLRMDQSMLPD